MYKLDIQQYQNREDTLKGMVFCHLQENLVINMVKKLIDTATKARIDAAKTASKRVVQRNAKATGHFIGNKVADKLSSFTKQNKE